MKNDIAKILYSEEQLQQRVREMGADILYEITFDRAGTKKLMATFAKLKKI